MYGGPPVLTPISWDDAYHVRVRAHDDPSVVSWHGSPVAISDDAGDKVDPVIEIES